MNKKVLFKILSQKNQHKLLELLSNAWKTMNTNQRYEVFEPVMRKEQYNYPALQEETLAAVKEFYDRSLAGDYYAPFDMNSKNFMDVPEETDAWFARLDALLIECTIQEALAQAKKDSSVGISIASLSKANEFSLFSTEIEEGHKVGCHYHKEGDEIYSILSGKGIIYTATVNIIWKIIKPWTTTWRTMQKGCEKKVRTGLPVSFQPIVVSC